MNLFRGHVPGGSQCGPGFGYVFGALNGCQAEVKELFANPRHPYTMGLLNSVPVFGRKKKDLAAIAGRVPDSTEEIRGCAYAARCPRRMKICGEKTPQLKRVGDGHDVACWLE